MVTITYTTEQALMLVLDQVDYVRGNCGITDMVGAVLPKEIIAIARKALERHVPGERTPHANSSEK